jgi:hypothetical protein
MLRMVMFASACVVFVLVGIPAAQINPMPKLPDKPLTPVLSGLPPTPTITIAPVPAAVQSYEVVVAPAPAHARSEPAIPRAATLSAGRSTAEELNDLRSLRQSWRQYCAVEGIRANLEGAIMVLNTMPAKLEFDHRRQTITYTGVEDGDLPGPVGSVLSDCPAALARLEREIATLEGTATPYAARRQYEDRIDNIRAQAGSFSVRVSDSAPSGSVRLPASRPLQMSAWQSPSQSRASCVPTQEVKRKWFDEPVRAGFDSSGKPYYHTVSKYVEIVVDRYPSGCK